MRLTLTAAFYALVFLLWTPAQAQLIDAHTYQGRLTTGGAPVVGTYRILMDVFDSPTGGATLWTESRTRTFTASDDGLFTFNDLNFGSVFDSGADRWIEISILPAAGKGSFTVLSPREPVTGAPYAKFSERSGTDLNDAYQNGSQIVASVGPVEILGELRLGSATNSGSLQVLSAEVGPSPIASIGGFLSFGGGLQLFDENTSTLVSAVPDANGQGGFVLIDGGPTGNVIVDGMQGAGGSPRVSINGGTSSFFFNTATFGDPSLILPADSVNSTEMLNEPGIASRSPSGNYTVTGAVGNVTLRSITVPGPGYVLAIASGSLGMSHVGGTFSSMCIGVSDESATLPSGQGQFFSITSAEPSGVRSINGSAHGVFNTPTAGGYTFYFVAHGSDTGGSQTISNINFTLIYLPTAYGATDTTRQGPGSLLDPAQGFDATRPTLSAVEIEREQAQERERYIASLEARQREMQRLMQEQRQEMDAILASQRADK